MTTTQHSREIREKFEEIKREREREREAYVDAYIPNYSETINGKTYSTETATLLADNWYSLSYRNRFAYGYCSGLYRTSDGTYFVYGEFENETATQPRHNIWLLAPGAEEAHYENMYRKHQPLR